MEAEMTKRSYVPPEGWAAYQKRRRTQMISEGLCRYCRKPAEPKKTICEYHLKWYSEYHKEQRRKKEG
jgi:hypothetical protein